MLVPIQKMPDCAVDRWWPYQISIKAHLCTGWKLKEKLEFCGGFGLFGRIDFVRDGEGNAYRVFCFSDAEQARWFREAFDGIPLYPEDRGLGIDRWKWDRPLGDVRRNQPLFHLA